MAFLTTGWNNEYAFGVEKIDTQHKKLFFIMEKISLLHDGSPNIRENIRRILYELSEYMQEHFRDEEVYMNAIGYPEIDHHKMLHAKIIEQVKSVASNGSNLGIIQTKLKFLIKKSMTDHIAYEDMKIKLFQHSNLNEYDDCTVEFEHI